MSNCLQGSLNDDAARRIVHTEPAHAVRVAVKSVLSCQSFAMIQRPEPCTETCGIPNL